MITKRSISKPDSKKEPGEIAIKQTMKQNSSHCSRPLSSSQTTTRPDRTRPTGPQAHGVPPGASGKPHATTSRGWRSGSPKAYPYHSPDPQKGIRKPMISSTPARPRETGNHSRRMGHTTDAKTAS